MKEDLTELVFILDKSGSMSGLEKDTIGGFNSMIEKQKNEAGEALVSVVLFDEKTRLLCDRVSLSQMKPLTEEEYQTGGSTALLDALGRQLKRTRRIQKESEEENRPAHTLFVITTDGEENSSRRYTFDKVKKTVTRRQKEDGWQFIFLGADIDAIGEASKIGIAADMAACYMHDAEGTDVCYGAVCEAATTVRKGAMLSPSVLGEVRADYKKRSSHKS